jgi:chromosome segregation ATPase
MKKSNPLKITLLTTLASAAAIVAGCNNQSGSEAGTDTNSVATNATMTASNAWQNTKEGATNAWDATKEASTNAWQKTKEVSTNAWEKTKEAFGAGSGTNEVSTNYFSDDFSQKDTYVAEARTTLDVVDQKIANLSDKISKAGDATKSQLQSQMQDLKDKRAELDQRYNDIKNSTADNWDNAKGAFEQAYYNVKDSIKSAWASLNNNNSTQ